jgi:ribose transport system permease protein
VSEAARRLFLRLGPLLGLALVVAFFALASGAPERYLSANNLRVVLAQTVTVAIAAIGMTLVIIGGGIDLSVGSVIALSGVLCATLLGDGSATATAVAAAVLLGGVVGVLNGLVITRLRIVPFIATLGMLGVARGAAKWLANLTTVNTPTTWVNDLAVTVPREAWMLFAPGVWLALGLAALMAFLRNGSQQMGWPSYVQEIPIGVIIVAAVAVDRRRHARVQA